MRGIAFRTFGAAIPTLRDLRETFAAADAALCRSVVNGTCVVRTLGFDEYRPFDTPHPRPDEPVSKRTLRKVPPSPPPPSPPVRPRLAVVPAPSWNPEPYPAVPEPPAPPVDVWATVPRPAAPGTWACPHCHQNALLVWPFMAGQVNMNCLTCGLRGSLPL